MKRLSFHNKGEIMKTINKLTLIVSVAVLSCASAHGMFRGISRRPATSPGELFKKTGELFKKTKMWFYLKIRRSKEDQLAKIGELQQDLISLIRDAITTTKKFYQQSGDSESVSNMAAIEDILLSTLNNEFNSVLENKKTRGHGWVMFLDKLENALNNILRPYLPFLFLKTNRTKYEEFKSFITKQNRNENN